MKFGNKEIPKQFVQDNKSFNKPAVKVDWKTLKLNYDALIPHGKHRNRTLGWVIQNDENYVSWLYKEQLFGDWGLVERKVEPIKSNSLYFLCESRNEKWVGLLECSVEGISSPYL